MDKVDWRGLSYNQNAIHILQQNLDKVDWYWLSRNPNAIHILEKNLEKVDWRGLSGNPNAIHILENNLDKLDWRELSKNTNFYKLSHKFNYLSMKNSMKDFFQELVAYVFRPNRLMRMSSHFNMDMAEYVEHL